MKAAMWLRVSSDEQSTGKDRDALETFARTLGAEVGRVYDVEGSAWKGNHRAALGAMLSDAAAGDFDVLLVTDVTRFSREGGDETLRVIKQLEAAGVQVRSIGDPELSGPLDFGRRISTFVKGELAHEQSNWKSLAVKRGMAKARADGKHVGRPKGRKDSPGVRRDRGSLKREQARRRLAGEGVYRKGSAIEKGSGTLDAGAAAG